jgi:hypothetical protein
MLVIGLSSMAMQKRDGRHQLRAGATMRRTSLAAILAVVLFAGCAARQVRIVELKDQPTKYNDKSVRVTGRVTNSFGIPLVPFQVYNVDDGTGEIAVVSRSGRAPATGTRIEVTGKVSEVAVIGGRSIGLHIEEDERRIGN